MAFLENVMYLSIPSKGRAMYKKWKTAQWREVAA
jgi:hypothetical protein